ncbi:hypothetical protein C0J52_13933 [Blattella germanica]|nr:hypothetical protein C0J52_13933 [Blattella germanica]
MQNRNTHRLTEPNISTSELWNKLKVIGLGRGREQVLIVIHISLDNLNESFVKNPTKDGKTVEITIDLSHLF